MTTNYICTITVSMLQKSAKTTFTFSKAFSNVLYILILREILRSVRQNIVHVYNVSETSRRHYRDRTMPTRAQDGARAVGADIGRSTFTFTRRRSL